MDEIWKDIPGYGGHYKVSSHGNVATCKWGGKFHVMSSRITKRGYYEVTLSKKGIKKGHNVHSLVALAFIGERPLGKEVCHWDGDRLNNHVSNLRYGTRLENVRDCIRHGRFAPRGIKNSTVLLSQDQVIDIFTSSDTCSNLARRYGIHYTHPGKIKSGKLWRWLTEPLTKKGIGDPTSMPSGMFAKLD